ncbi:MAG: M43 family zinc metalloprotease [Spirosomataceae bacterium]
MSGRIGLVCLMVGWLGQIAWAQQDRCGIIEYEKYLMQKYPERVQHRLKLEQEISDYMRENANVGARITEPTLRIPVVVHIMHNNTSGFIGGANNPNISDEQVISQIKVLNEDYRRKEGTKGYNSNPVGADMNIEFYLANKDPNGNATSGITRHLTTYQSVDFYADWDAIAAIVSWPSECYLNIWVVPSSDNYLALAQYPSVDGFSIPGLNNATEQLVKTDGIICNYDAFGTVGAVLTGKHKTLYGLGRSVTHEIGHWLGLFHTWGDSFCGTDYVDDTPTAEGSNAAGKLTCDPITSNCGGKKTTNMIENYMDYSPDPCMNTFTLGQKTRTRAVFVRAPRRKKLLTCFSSLPTSDKLTVSVYPNPTSSTANLDVLLNGTQDVTVELLDMSGKVMFKDNYSQIVSNSLTLRTDNIADGLYLIRVSTSSESVTKRISVVH